MAINTKQQHFLQTEDWKLFQQALGKIVVTRQGDGWSYQAIIGPNPGRIAKYLKCVFLPYGPTFSDHSSLKNALEDVEQLSRDTKADQIVVEPYLTGQDVDISDIMVGLGYSKLKKSRQPELTLITDLSGPWDEVLLGMSKTNRYQWRYIERDQISFQKTHDDQDVDDFAEMMHQTSVRTGANFPAKSYYQTMAKTLGKKGRAGIVYGLYKGKRLVGTLYVDDVIAKRRYYFYAGSYDEMRGIKVALNAALVMYLQKDAQDSGMNSLDYFGVAPLSAPTSHHWYGLSKFKRSLGGEDFATLGSWEKPLNKFKFSLVKKLQQLIVR